jgi:membrane associated rhomboid family serine protease
VAVISRRRGGAVTQIIVINVLVFVAWQLWGSTENDQNIMVQNFLVSWNGLVEGRYWTLLTSVFSHNTFWHILLNMMVLRSFGGIIESMLGYRRFITFYLSAGVFSSLCHCIVSLLILHQPEIPALGASGAISGLVLVFALMFPREKILIFGLIPVPALIGSVAFVGLDVWGLVAQAGGGGLPIGHGAHLGGALAGLIYYWYYLKPKMRPRTPSPITAP